MAVRRKPGAGSEILLALALAGAGLFFLVHQWLYPAGTTLFGVSPSTLPMAMSGLILLLALIMLARALAVARPSAQRRDGDRAALRRVGALVALSIAYVAALPWLGYLAASALFIGASAWIFGARRPLTVAALMVLAPLALSAFFERAMVIYLPEGTLLFGR